LTFQKLRVPHFSRSLREVGESGGLEKHWSADTDPTALGGGFRLHLGHDGFQVVQRFGHGQRVHFTANALARLQG